MFPGSTLVPEPSLSRWLTNGTNMIVVLRSFRGNSVLGLVLLAGEGMEDGGLRSFQ